MKYLGIEVTGRCNLTCRWCGVPRCNQDLPFEEFTRAVKKYAPKAATLTGGEPLLHPDILKFVDFCKSRSMRVGINTNGTLITDGLARRINADSFSVSIDDVGSRNDKIRGRGSFERAVNGLRLLEKHGKLDKASIHICLSKLNAGAARRVIGQFYPRIRRFVISRVVPAARAHGDVILNRREALREWLSLLPYILNPRIKIAFSLEFGSFLARGLAGPVIRSDGKPIFCCAKRSEIKGSLKQNYCYQFCSGCVECLLKSFPSSSS